MYKCEHFSIEELVPPKVFQDRGQKAWQLLDDRMLITLDRLREKYGSMTVNSWKWGGDREWSGLRTPDSPYYSKYSQHSFGRAADVIFKHITAEEVRQAILENPDDPTFELINSFEEGVSWLHFDVRNCDRVLTYPVG
mgnify:CR=1 FL=1|jgi:hypothetical protein